MYLQDIFTEQEYNEILNDIKNLNTFDYKRFKFGKTEFSIALHKSEHLDIWTEGYMVSIHLFSTDSGYGRGENPSKILGTFKTYKDACKYIDSKLKHYVKPNDKYQGLKKEEQMNIFDFLEGE